MDCAYFKNEQMFPYFKKLRNIFVEGILSFFPENKEYLYSDEFLNKFIIFLKKKSTNRKSNFL
jgi:hypothetical protein